MGTRRLLQKALNNTASLAGFLRKRLTFFRNCNRLGPSGSHVLSVSSRSASIDSWSSIPAPTVSLHRNGETQGSWQITPRRETMAKLMEGREARVRNLVLMLARSLALGYLAITVIGSPMAEAQHGPGDTPVVLIGGSLRFKGGMATANDSWQQVVLNKDYYYPASYPVGVIVLKQKAKSKGDGPDPDDANPGTDRTPVPISNPSWRADLFTVASPNTPVAHLMASPGSLQIHIVLDDANGYLCPVGTPIKKVTYNPTKNCTTHAVSFSKVNITVNGVAATPGSLTCQDSAGTNYHCKIVLRAH